MKLYRVFPWSSRAGLRELGGALYIARDKQGNTRHGIPESDGVLYTSVDPESAVAERMKSFRGSSFNDADFVLKGSPAALATIDLLDDVRLANLTDSKVLANLGVQPVEVATHDYRVTQKTAQKIFDLGYAGILWWSSLEAKWTNATLFESRAGQAMTLSEDPVLLTVAHPYVIAAANFLNIKLVKSKRGRA